MICYKSQIQNIRYIPETGEFEALVTLHEGADRVSYPCSVKAPITVEFAELSQALVLQAKLRRAQRNTDLVMRLVQDPSTNAMPDLRDHRAA